MLLLTQPFADGVELRARPRRCTPWSGLRLPRRPGGNGQAASYPAGVESVHPVRLAVTDDLRRSRLTVFFRWILAIPHFIWLALWGVAALVAGLVAWFAALVLGRVPLGLHTFIAGFVRYATHVYAYQFLLANPFPGFTGKEGSYPVDLEIDPPVPQGRLAVFFRLILAIPAWIFASVLQYVLQIVAFLGWFVCLFLGRMPEGMRNLGAYCLRYYMQTEAYSLLLTPRYPSLAGGSPGEPPPSPSPVPPADPS